MTELKKGDVILVQGRGPISSIIRYFTGNSYTHSACYIGDWKIIESDWDGVWENTLDKYIDDVYHVYRHPTASKEQLNHAVEWMKMRQGAKYDYLGILGIALAIMGKKKINKLDNTDRYWCSELVADGFLHADIPLYVHPKTYRVSPGDLSKNLEQVI